MRNLHVVLAGLIACTIAVATVQADFASPLRFDDKSIKLTGCLVKGEGDGGYLVTNLPSEPASTSSAEATVVPSAVGTSGGSSPIFYWLDDDHGLERHVGHRVEIDGRLKGDLKEGEIKLERRNNWTDVTVKSDGRSMKAVVPNASMFPASARDERSNRKVTAIVRKVDVDHVRMLAARCE
jgi:hypothetical protein